MVMKNRVMRGSVTVIGPPRRICSWKIGTTLPFRSQHVAEADDGETRRGDLGEGVDVALGQLLRGPHDAGRMHGLVGRDEDEIPHAELVGQVGQALGAVDVVLHRLADVALHQRHVLVGGRMEDHLRPVLLEELPHPRAVGDAGDAGVQSAVAVRWPAAGGRS